MNFALGHIQLNLVARLHKRQRTAHVALRRKMQHAHAVAGAAHAGIREAHHIAHALLQQFVRNRQHPPLGEAGTTFRAGITQHEHGIRRDVQFGIVQFGFEIRIIIKHQRRPAMVEKILRSSGGFHHTTVRREITAQYKRAALGLHGIFRCANHIVINQLRIGNILSDRTAGDGRALAM